MAITKSSSKTAKLKESVSLPSSVSTSRHATIGAPSQPSQTSRKGKKAWRKNISISAIEEGLEELREEERILGGPVKDKKDEDLFTIDLTGDEKLRRTLKTKKPLTSTLILAQRSAVPSVSSRTKTNSYSTDKGVQVVAKTRLSKEEKEKLAKIAHRPRKGPLNAIVEGGPVGEVSEAVKSSGTYDVWMTQSSDEESPIQKKNLPKPKTPSLRAQISAPAIPSPHQGISYNPPLEPYTNLLSTAIEAEQRRLATESKLDALKNKMQGALDSGEGVEGMILDLPDTRDDEEEVEEEEGGVAVRPTKRKTERQRKKALKAAQEKRALQEKAQQKKLLAAVSQLRSLRKQIDSAHSEQEKQALERRLVRAEELSKGLTGQRIGRHKIKSPEIDVQLGEDLSENLRGLKSEGNLFKERAWSLMNRGLMEPRERVLPSKRSIKHKEVEKFAWKRFQ